MTKEEAAAGLMYLTASTPGWSHDSVAVYVEQCMRFPNPDAFIAAMRKLAMRWSKTSRPLPFDVTAAYNAEVAERELDERYAITEGHDSSSYPDFADGVKIAWEAYCGECRRQGKEPNRTYFEKWLPAAG